MIKNHNRYQKGLILSSLYPSRGGLCACGCGKRLTGRQTRWASQECGNDTYMRFAVIKGDNNIIRKELFKRDEGYCSKCGVYDNTWEADHITPVSFGGGGNDLSNFQTLCQDCHKEKTKIQSIMYSKWKQLPDTQQLIFV